MGLGFKDTLRNHAHAVSSEDRTEPEAAGDFESGGFGLCSRQASSLNPEPLYTLRGQT